ncbi:unnamed protein product [Rangifer tarandus platyrhynchus]|uniref:Uncharacterized protein n=2 Tax=Rangifer tarandus platyrhynchus TaxID=3082113 RepID=A0ACB0ER22_RANTA|nr:unnamed protein product [Rangifer tarandus platyrhynchus]CAI9703217.1 unnamed protein product [Rangifer tarandus platyrhynchus]
MSPYAATAEPAPQSQQPPLRSHELLLPKPERLGPVLHKRRRRSKKPLHRSWTVALLSVRRESLPSNKGLVLPKVNK